MQAQKTSEQSMEDILASIRKIIADDPGSPKAAPPPPPPALSMPPIGAPLPAPLGTPLTTPSPHPAEGLAAPGTGQVMSGQSAPTPPPPRAPLASLDQELDDLLRDPIDVPPAVRPAAASLPLPSAPSPLKASPAAMASPPPPVTLGAARNEPAKQETASTFSWFRGKSRSHNDTAAGPANEAPLSPSLGMPGVEPHAELSVAEHNPPLETFPSPEPELPVVVPPEAKPAMAAHQTMGDILGRLAQATAPAATPVAPFPAPPPGRQFDGAPSRSDMPAPVGDPTVAGTAAAIPAIDVADVSPAKTVAAPSAAIPVPTPAPPSAASAAMAAAAAALASDPPPPPIAPAKAKAEDQQVSAPEAPIPASTPPVAQTPAPSATGPTSVVTVPRQEVLPPQSATQAVGAARSSIDDTLAELMRPMVRQWLDENMQRALEKAVRVEVADSLKRTKAAQTEDGETSGS